jgi:hypothetical protein
MTHYVTIHQLTSPNNGSSFLNVDCEEGHIGVCFSIFNKPTYLMNLGNNQFELIQFDSEAWAKEYMGAYPDDYFQRLG